MSSVPPNSWRQTLLHAAVLLLLTTSGFAALGRDANSIQDDKVHLKAAHRIARTESSYTVHEMTVPSGTTVREFVSPAGKVFGVAWQGPWLPDLQQLLGDYFEPVMQASREQRRGRGPLMIDKPEIVFHSTGHMRSFSGRAYLPGMLPKGLDPGVIQ